VSRGGSAKNEARLYEPIVTPDLASLVVSQEAESRPSASSRRSAARPTPRARPGLDVSVARERDAATLRVWTDLAQPVRGGQARLLRGLLVVPEGSALARQRVQRPRP
jgi:hypothetical protein